MSRDRGRVVNAFAWLDNPPAHVVVTSVGRGAAFFYRVACARCRAVETTYSPTEANAICIEHARCKEAEPPSEPTPDADTEPAPRRHLGKRA